MAVYGVKADLYFDGATQNDAWAAGIVDQIVAFVRELGLQSSVVGGISAEERQSYAFGYQLVSGVPQVRTAWQMTAGGIVNNLDPVVETPPPATAAWVTAKAYAVGDLVTWNGGTYRCLQAHTSNQAAGWTPAVASLWAVA